jgi:phosphoserine phosphatase
VNGRPHSSSTPGMLVLVRHGETAWNVGEIFRGRADIELNEMGRRQASLVAAHLSELSVDAVFSSPLKRAMDTAEAIAAPHASGVTVAHGLNDLAFGEWEGKSVDLVRRSYPEQFEMWESHPERVTLPGGESLKDVRERALGVVDAALALRMRGVVLVSHRVVNKLIILALLGLGESCFWNVTVDPCSVTIFRHDGGRFVLTKHNDTCFLEPAGARPLADF